MKKLLMFAAVMGIVLGGMLVTAPAPASAHPQCLLHDEADEGKTDTACISKDHRKLKVCDGEKDGNRVEAWVWWPSGPLAFEDKDGSKGDCSHYKLPRGAHRFAICENNEGCVPGNGKYVEA